MRQSVLEIKELANRAGQGISMDPERMGANLLQECDNGLNAFLAQIPEELQGEYEKRYISKYSEWLHALSRTFSVMVTGAGNFNNRRHQKMNDYEQSARERFETWKENVVKRVNRQQRLVGWEEVERLQSKLDTLTELQEKMKAVNKIVRNGKLSDEEQREELEALGQSESSINGFMAEPQYSFMKKGFQTYQLSNNLAKIKDIEQAIKRHTVMATTEDKEYKFDGGKVVICNSDERIRIYFDEIPNSETRSMLKGNAFKWSPKNKAWQRQLTPNAKFALKHYIQLPGFTFTTD
uniref:Uncharacterized protein n=1 Tax=Siphoviridae sp. ctIEo13 TaxID=2827833 RepID=A0A8S5TJD3_9CAUD|nr:MAG TPA: hypothetical protein [Siphoviridae sp. ctIEo13]